MDKYELRRTALKRLVDGLGHGGISRVATKIGKEPNYVSRMLYPDDKPGRKRIGEDSVELLSREFPGWIDDGVASVAENTPRPTHHQPDVMLIDEAYQSPSGVMVLAVKEAQVHLGLTGAPSCEASLMGLSRTLDKITPMLREAAHSAVMKWLRGEASVREVARTIDALVEASHMIDMQGNADKAAEQRIHQTAQYAPGTSVKCSSNETDTH